MAFLDFLGLFPDAGKRAAALPQASNGSGFATFLPSSDIDAAPIKNDTQALENYLGWVYIAVSTIAEDIRALAYSLKRRDGKDGIEVAEHDFLRVLRQPNATTNYADFIEVTCASYLLTGQFFWHIVTSLRDKAEGLQFIAPGWVDEPVFTDGVHSHWRVTVPGHPPRMIPVEDLIWIKKPHPLDPFDAASPLEAIAVSHYFDQYLRAYGTSLLKNDAAVPAGLLQSDMELTADQAEDIRARWIKKRRHRRDDVAVLGKGTRYQQLAIPIQDIRFLEIGDFGIDQVLAVYKVPRAVVGVSREFNRANMSGAFRFYQQQALRPLARLIETTINVQVKPRFLTPQENRSHYFELGNPVESDKELIRQEALEKLQSGAYQVNEYRQALGDEPRPDGNVYLVPTKVRVMPSLEPEKPKDKKCEVPLGGKLALIAAKRLPKPDDDVKKLSENVRALSNMMHVELSVLKQERDALQLERETEKLFKRIRSWAASEQARHKRENLDSFQPNFQTITDLGLTKFALQEDESLQDTFEQLKGQRGKAIALSLASSKHGNQKEKS